MRLLRSAVRFVVVGSLTCSVCFGLVSIWEHGSWPETWPKDLDSLRDTAKTSEVRHGIQETQYELTFEDSATFEKAWPYVLSLKSEGAPLILEKGPSTSNVSGSTLKLGIRILCPPGGRMIETEKDAKYTLDLKGPLPKSVLTSLGTLPEYVVLKDGKFAPYTEGQIDSVRTRVRTDIVLVVDGRIIDLNRIKLPTDTQIVDHRFQDTTAN